MKRIAGMALLMLAAAVPAGAAAQDASARLLDAARIDAGARQPRWIWGGAGLSLGTAGIGAGLDLSVLSDDRLWSGRLTFQGTADMGGNLDAEQVLVSELAVMYGRGRRVAGGNWGSVSAGLALVAGDREDEAFETVGIPLQAQLISRRMPHLGATLAANLNTEAPFAAFILSLQVGRVP